MFQDFQFEFEIIDAPFIDLGKSRNQGSISFKLEGLYK